MATESPIRILEGTDKWAPLKQPSRYESSSSAKIAIEDLDLFMKGQKFQSFERDVIPSRSGSAPPSVEGSMAAIGYMISQRKSTFNPHAMCADGSLQLPTSSLPSYQEEYEDDGSSEQCGSQSFEKVTFVDSGSFDSTQELSLSYKPVKEMVVPEAESHRHDVSGSISTCGTNTPSPDNMRQVSQLDGAEGNVVRTALYDRDRNAVKVAHKDNISTSGVTDADNIQIEAEKRVSIASASNSDSNKFHNKEQSPPKTNIRQQQESSSSIVQGSYPQMMYPGLSNPYGSLNPIYYGSATAFMTSPYSFYPNMQPAGLFTPQYGMSGYVFNPAVIPSYIAGFSPRHAGPMVFDGASVPTIGVSDGGNMHACDMHNLLKFYGQFGVQVQPSFSDPFHMQGFQPPAQDLHGKYGHIGHQTPRDGAVVDQVNLHELKKGVDLVGFSHDHKSVHSAGTGYKSMNFRKCNLSNPTNVSPLPQFPSASSVGQVVSARPAGEIYVPRGRYNTSHSHSSGNPGKTFGLQNQNWNDMNPYSFLEELKSGKGPKFELIDVAGHIVEFSVDQHGSRFIQQQLENCSYEAKAFVFKEVIPHAPKLMTDVFGNYVIQKLFEYGSPEQRKDLANQLEGQILQLSLQMYGCRVIQKAVEVIDLEQKARLVRELDGHVLKCVRDQNGNHVIQKCIETIPTDKIHFIISSFRGQVAILSMHPYGCRVIQRILEHCKDELHIQFIVDEILDSVYSLAQDQYGNYVTQHVLERGKPHERSIIVEKLLGSIVQLSQHKFASNVIEKCLNYCDSTARGTLMKEIVGHDEKSENLLIMMKDQYANYVIQKILRKCTSDQREMLIGLIRNHLAALKKYTYGKHIVARFEELCVEEIQRPEP